MSTVIARRRAIEQAGAFSPEFPAYEDFDLWLRVAHLRERNLFCIKALNTDYRCREGQITGNWKVMRAGWEAVMAKHLALYPDTIRPLYRDARGNHLEYCSYLAVRAGAHADARSLMLRSWACSGPRHLLRPIALVMTAACLATYLPQPMQARLRRAYAHLLALRQARVGWWSGAGDYRPNYRAADATD
jgi:hypothetical protein